MVDTSTFSEKVNTMVLSPVRVAVNVDATPSEGVTSDLLGAVFRFGESLTEPV